MEARELMGSPYSQQSKQYVLRHVEDGKVGKHFI
jgi:hypothetical protein